MVAVVTVGLVVRGAWAGPYRAHDNGVAYDDPCFVGWATGIEMHWPSGFTPGSPFDDTSRALGPAPGSANDVVSLGDEGWAVLTFDRVIRNNPGADLAVFENGFGNIFAELAFVEVSSDNVHYARFPSVSLNATCGEYAMIDATNIYNLAGKHVNNYQGPFLGTPFDLADLEDHPLVTSGDVDLDNINYVRIVDIYGDSDGTTYDEATSLVDPTTGLAYTTNHVIHDPGNAVPDPQIYVSTTGFDLDAVGILEPIPEPATAGLIVLAAVALLANRKKWGQSPF